MLDRRKVVGLGRLNDFAAAREMSAPQGRGYGGRGGPQNWSGWVGFGWEIAEEGEGFGLSPSLCFLPTLVWSRFQMLGFKERSLRRISWKEKVSH